MFRVAFTLRAWDLLKLQIFVIENKFVLAETKSSIELYLTIGVTWMEACELKTD